MVESILLVLIIYFIFKFLVPKHKEKRPAKSQRNNEDLNAQNNYQKSPFKNIGITTRKELNRAWDN